jgi:hypothetical protein
VPPPLVAVGLDQCELALKVPDVTVCVEVFRTKAINLLEGSSSLVFACS